MTKKVVLVTGSSRGIGKAIAVKFAREGYHVILNCARRERELLCTKKEIERLHASSCLSFLGDMGDFPTCEKLFSQIRQQYQRVVTMTFLSLHNPVKISVSVTCLCMAQTLIASQHT